MMGRVCGVVSAIDCAIAQSVTARWSHVLQRRPTSFDGVGTHRTRERERESVTRARWCCARLSATAPVTVVCLSVCPVVASTGGSGVRSATIMHAPIAQLKKGWGCIDGTSAHNTDVCERDKKRRWGWTRFFVPRISFAATSVRAKDCTRPSGKLSC